MKRVFIVHRWAGGPHEVLYVWLKSELELRGYEVHVPGMPNPEQPEIDEWVAQLSAVVGRLDSETFFIGHSIGAQAVLRYLETQKTKCGGAVFIAGWFTLQGLETEEEHRISDPWLEAPIDFDKIRRNLPRSRAIFSDNDPYVPLSDKDIFKEKLGSEIVIEHDKGHFTIGDNITTLPSAISHF